jgi:hypothetical protein
MHTTSASLPSSLLLASARQAEALQEAVVALRAHRVAGEQVQRDDLGRLAAQRGLGVLADQHAGLVVVGGKQRVGAVTGSVGLSSAITMHALVARLLDGRQDGLAVAGRDEDGLGTGGDHVLHRRHLAGVVAVGLAGAVSSLAPLALAASAAPSFIFTKKGLVSVLVIRPITGCAGGQRSRRPATGRRAGWVAWSCLVSWVRWGVRTGVGSWRSAGTTRPGAFRVERILRRRLINQVD